MASYATQRILQSLPGSLKCMTLQESNDCHTRTQFTSCSFFTNSFHMYASWQRNAVILWLEIYKA
jgi:hypothetical protein